MIVLLLYGAVLFLIAAVIIYIWLSKKKSERALAEEMGKSKDNL